MKYHCFDFLCNFLKPYLAFLNAEFDIKMIFETLVFEQDHFSVDLDFSGPRASFKDGLGNIEKLTLVLDGVVLGQKVFQHFFYRNDQILMNTIYE